MTNYTQNLQTKIKAIIDEFEQIDNNTQWKIGYGLYTDYHEIANYQLSRVLNALKIANQDAYREAFAILRVGFENYLYYLLMTKGKRYFHLFSKQKGKGTKKSVQDYNTQIAGQKAAGNKFIIKALAAKDGLIEVHYEGQYVDGKKRKDNLVPVYLDIFKNFNPDLAHLSPTGYFEHYPKPRRYKNLTIRNSKGAKNTYRHYLTFDAILYCLRLNRLSSIEKDRRVKAHYNFLSQFVHPNYKAISSAKVANRLNSDVSVSALNEHSDNLQLLCSLYSGYITCGVISAYLDVLGSRPNRFIASINDAPLRTLINDFYSDYGYFWFIYNKPSDYDKFWCRVSGSARTYTTYPTFQQIPDSKVKFNADILRRITDLQRGMSNGSQHYQPPFTNV